MIFLFCVCEHKIRLYARHLSSSMKSSELRPEVTLGLLRKKAEGSWKNKPERKREATRLKWSGAGCAIVSSGLVGKKPLLPFGLSDKLAGTSTYSCAPDSVSSWLWSHHAWIHKAFIVAADFDFWTPGFALPFVLMAAVCCRCTELVQHLNSAFSSLIIRIKTNLGSYSQSGPQLTISVSFQETSSLTESGQMLRWKWGQVGRWVRHKRLRQAAP